MKKFLSLIFAILACFVWQGARSAVIVPGQRLLWSDLKAGDSILLRNATCDVGRASDTENPGSEQYLNLNKFVTGSWDTNHTTMAVEVPSVFTTDYVAILEDADPNPLNGSKRFYLKCATNGRYFAATGNGTAGNYRIWTTDNRAEATWLEPRAMDPDYDLYYSLSAAGNWAFVNTQVDDSTMAFMHQDINVATADTTATWYLGPAWSYQFAHYSTRANDVIMWNVYRAMESTSARDLLKTLFTKTAEVDHYVIGTTPGCYSEEAVGQLVEQRAITEDFLYETHSEEECQIQLDALQKAFDNVKASFVKVTDGYYNFVNAYNRYIELQDVEKAMTVDSKGNLAWATKDTLSAMQLFKVTVLTDTSYSIQNVGTGMYINTVAGQSNIVPMSKEQITPQTFTVIAGSDQFNIANIANSLAYHTGGHLTGRGPSGNIVTWDGGVNSCSAWKIIPVTDQDLITSILAKASSEFASQSINDAITAANAARDRVAKYKPLITKANQFNSNNSSETELSKFANLIDGNVDYHSNFASTWNKTLMEDASVTADAWQITMDEQQAQGGDNRGIGIGYHNLQVTLDKPVQKFFFSYIGRTNTSYVDNPSDIEIFATNDDALGADPNNSNQDQWTRITEIDKGFPGILGGVTYTSPEIDMGAPYKYVRFLIKKTATMNRLGYNRQFANPNITGVTWNVGEFNMYDGTSDATAQYYTVPGMKEAVDNLDKVISGVRAKIADNTASFTDTTSIINATKAVNALYVNRDSLYSVMQDLISQGYEAYDQALPSKSSLISDPNTQFSTNNMSAQDAGSFEHLVDGNYHHSSNFHSCWLTSMSQEGMTADEWTEALKGWAEGDANNIYVGTGYHDLQVNFLKPTQNFWFEMVSRTGTSYTDTPNDIGVFATNDDALGADPDMSNIGQWTELTRLQPDNKTLPDQEGVRYTSPIFGADQAWKYVRLVVYGTTHMKSRSFGSPDVTGVTWNVGDLNFYTGADPDKAQYNYDPELKTAVDGLKTIIDADTVLKVYQVQDTVEIGRIRAALAKVQSLLVDTTQFGHLSKKYGLFAENAVAGKGTGYADSQESIDAFAMAVAGARAMVDTDHPTVKQVNAAVTALNTAYDTYVDHVGKPATDKWYYILSSTSDDDTAPEGYYPARDIVNGAALYVLGSGKGESEGVYTPGNQLRWGMDDIKDKSTEGDADAVWRFIAAPDSLGKQTYYIQNLRTGFYIGDCNTSGNDYYYYQVDTTSQAFRVEFPGDGQINIVAVNGSRPEVALSFGDNARQVRGDAIEQIPGNRAALRLEPFEENEFMLDFNNNTVRVVTLPFSVSNINSTEGVKTYAIHSMPSDREIGLVEKTGFKAGEPFILVVGDTALNDGTVEKVSIPFATPSADDMATLLVADTVNGLVGTYRTFDLRKGGFGYFTATRFRATEEKNAVTIDAHTGYVDPGKITTLAGDPSVVISVTGDNILNDIAKTVLTKAAGKVNVYTVDGTLVKRNVKASEAKDGLARGIYIIGRKKVIVR